MYIFQEEDDGILLASLIWGGSDTNRVGLIILDAKTMTEIGRAEFNVLSPIPLCFHGLFVSEKTSKPQKDVQNKSECNLKFSKLVKYPIAIVTSCFILFQEF